MQKSDKGREEEEMLVRELTEDDLADIYGGAKGGHGSPGPNGINLSGLHLPNGISIPNLSDFANMVPGSSSGNNTPAEKSPSSGVPSAPGGGGLGGGLGGLLGGLPLGLPLL